MEPAYFGVVITQEEVEQKILQLEAALRVQCGDLLEVLRLEAELINAHRYLEVLKIYHKIIEKYKGDSKMVKELTVKEISKALGYEVKVVKEQPLNIPKDVFVGQVYEINGNKYMVAALGGTEVGLTSVGDCAGCWSSSLIEGPVSYDEIRTRLIELRAKFLGTFGFVFRTTK